MFLFQTTKSDVAFNTTFNKVVAGGDAFQRILDDLYAWRERLKKYESLGGNILTLNKDLDNAITACEAYKKIRFDDEKKVWKQHENSSDSVLTTALNTCVKYATDLKSYYPKGKINIGDLDDALYFLNNPETCIVISTDMQGGVGIGIEKVTTKEEFERLGKTGIVINVSNPHRKSTGEEVLLYLPIIGGILLAKDSVASFLRGETVEGVINGVIGAICLGTDIGALLAATTAKGAASVVLKVKILSNGVWKEETVTANRLSLKAFYDIMRKDLIIGDVEKITPRFIKMEGGEVLTRVYSKTTGNEVTSLISKSEKYVLNSEGKIVEESSGRKVATIVTHDSKKGRVLDVDMPKGKFVTESDGIYFKEGSDAKRVFRFEETYDDAGKKTVNLISESTEFEVRGTQIVRITDEVPVANITYAKKMKVNVETIEPNEIFYTTKENDIYVFSKDKGTTEKIFEARNIVSEIEVSSEGVSKSPFMVTTEGDVISSESLDKVGVFSSTDRRVMSKIKNGDITVSPEGHVLDKEGRVLGKLETNNEGKVVFKTPDKPSSETTIIDQSGKPMEIVASEQYELSFQAESNFYMDEQGKIFRTNSEGKIEEVASVNKVSSTTESKVKNIKNKIKDKINNLKDKPADVELDGLTLKTKKVEGSDQLVLGQFEVNAEGKVTYVPNEINMRKSHLSIKVNSDVALTDADKSAGKVLNWVLDKNAHYKELISYIKKTPNDGAIETMANFFSAQLQNIKRGMINTVGLPFAVGNAIKNFFQVGYSGAKYFVVTRSWPLMWFASILEIQREAGVWLMPPDKWREILRSEDFLDELRELVPEAVKYIEKKLGTDKADATKVSLEDGTYTYLNKEYTVADGKVVYEGKQVVSAKFLEAFVKDAKLKVTTPADTTGKSTEGVDNNRADDSTDKKEEKVEPPFTTLTTGTWAENKGSFNKTIVKVIDDNSGKAAQIFALVNDLPDVKNATDKLAAITKVFSTIYKNLMAYPNFKNTVNELKPDTYPGWMATKIIEHLTNMKSQSQLQNKESRQFA